MSSEKSREKENKDNREILRNLKNKIEADIANGQICYEVNKRNRRNE